MPTNVKIGNLITIYADTFQGALPPFLDTPAQQSGGPYAWYSKLEYSSGIKATNSGGKAIGIYRCPVAEDRGADGTWAYNSTLGNRLGTNPSTFKPSVLLHKLKNPSLTGILMDGMKGYGSFDSTDRVRPAYQYRSVEYRHENGLNVLYAAGNVSYQKMHPVQGLTNEQIARPSFNILYY